MKNLNPIIALVGPTGAGKTTIAEKIVARLPDRYGFLPGFLTRPLRAGEEAYNLTVVSAEEGRRRYADFREGKAADMVNMAEYAGTYYGNERHTADAFLKERTALKDLVPAGVMNFRKAGYIVHVVLVTPIGHAPRPGREEADREQALLYPSLGAVLTVVTDHRDPHGPLKAYARVFDFFQYGNPASAC